MGPKECVVSINLKCSPEKIRRDYRPQRPLVCPFSIQFNGQYFPSQSWDDFVIPILTDWSRRLGDYLNGMTSEIILKFMDGPYLVKIAKQKDGALLTCAKKTGKEHNIMVCYVDVPAFFRSVIESAHAIDMAVENAGIDDMDIADLRAELSRINI